MIVGHGLVRNTGCPALDQALGLGPVRSQVQVREQRVMLAQHGPLDGLWLLYLDDHLGRLEHGGGIGKDAGTGSFELLVFHSDTVASGRLHENLVAPMSQFTHGSRNEPYAVLVILDFLGYTNFH